MRISDWSSDVCSSDLEFWVQNRGEMLRVDAHQVDLIEAERDYMRLHVGGRSWLIHQTIKSLEERMDPDRFLRIHRSKMVRRDGIVEIGRAHVLNSSH